MARDHGGAEVSVRVARLTLDQPAMIVITGAMAAGKSTIAGLLARRFARGVHIEADVLHGLIVAGRVGVCMPGTPQGEAARQPRLRLRRMCLPGRSFHEAGFAVVLDDLTLGDRWEQLREELLGIPFALNVLAPGVDVLVQRGTGRSKPSQGTPGRGTLMTRCARRCSAPVTGSIAPTRRPRKQSRRSSADSPLDRVGSSPPLPTLAPERCRTLYPHTLPRLAGLV